MRSLRKRRSKHARLDALRIDGGVTTTTAGTMGPVAMDAAGPFLLSGRESASPGRGVLRPTRPPSLVVGSPGLLIEVLMAGRDGMGSVSSAQR